MGFVVRRYVKRFTHIVDLEIFVLKIFCQLNFRHV